MMPCDGQGVSRACLDSAAAPTGAAAGFIFEE